MEIVENTKQFFNLYQSNIFISKGCTVLGCGMEKNKAYITFETNELFYDLLEKWNNRTLLK